LAGPDFPTYSGLAMFEGTIRGVDIVPGIRLELLAFGIGPVYF
jgi:hypothetical protein